MEERKKEGLKRGRKTGREGGGREEKVSGGKSFAEEQKSVCYCCFRTVDKGRLCGCFPNKVSAMERRSRQRDRRG